jgi:hypothetical protein
MIALDRTPFAWPAAAIAALTTPTLIIIGDCDGTRPEHAVELFRLRRWRVRRCGRSARRPTGRPPRHHARGDA